ncbi:hypothetical protein MMC19_005780 [Ptychographa xylographoides]|nr:hypothetical protein [Ptychographa xylographoides]
MVEPAMEKAPVDHCDYEGLQLDTRARDQTEKDLDTPQELNSPVSPEQYQNFWDDEKNLIAAREAREAQRAAPSQYTPVSAGSTKTLVPPDMVSQDGTPAERKPQRICGLRRGLFWTFLILILAIIVIAAIVGGLLAARRNSSSTPSPSATPSPSTAPSIVPGSSNPSLPESDVIVDSPIALVAFTANATGSGSSAADEQAFRVYFQSAHGNVKESRYDGELAPWQEPNPLFTDAINNTGLAAYTYLNETVQQSSIFYVSSSFMLQEKRLYPGTSIWEPGTINDHSFKVYGNLSSPETNSQDNPGNPWDGFRMAAVYSTAFANGPGARLFYHSQSSTGLPMVQELIWTQENDTWSNGFQFLDPWPNSDLSATIDDATQTLRLFYSSGNLTLEESWTSVADLGATYQPGIKIPALLTHNDAAIAAVSTSTNTMVYYYATHGVLSIRELTLFGTPSANSNSETFTNPTAAPVVAQPALVTSYGQLSIYQPIGAVVSTAAFTEQSISVFWAEEVADIGSGYGALKTTSRNTTDPWPASSYGQGTGQVTISLGDNNANP